MPDPSPNPSSGVPAKAFLHVVDRDSGSMKQLLSSTAKPSEGGDFVFHYNPETISVEKRNPFQDHRTQGSDSGQKEWTHGTSRTLQISELYFDTYEKKANVRSTCIDYLEKLAHYDPELHRPPKLLFLWGNFMAENDEYNSCQWYLSGLKISYVMFLSDGTPVRAKVELTLVEATTVEKQQQKDPQSPDHAKVYTVTRGDTLQSIAYREYDDPAEWRRIAEVNGIDDPMNVEPGTRLLVPPILK